VSFTKSQENTIRRLVETGQIVKAQKLIVRELTAEFGGSAKAAGDTLPGKLNILKESLRNLGGTIAEDLAPKLGEVVDKFNEWLSDPANQKRVMDDGEKGLRGIGRAAQFAADTVGLFVAAARKVQDLKDFFEPFDIALKDLPDHLAPKASRFKLADLWRDEGEKSAAAYKSGFVGVAAEIQDKILMAELRHRRERRPPRQDQTPPPPTPKGPTANERAARRNQWFDAGIARQLNRLQDLGLRKQLAALRALAAQVRERLAATSDATRRLTLEDKLLDIARQQRDVQTQITDQILAANQALRDRADAIKSAVLERLERRQQDVLNRRALRDAQERLRLAKLIGGPLGTRAALENLQDVRFDMLRGRLEAAPATLTRGGRFQLGNIVTINVHGVTDPNAVAIKVDEILKKRGRRSSNPTSGTGAGGGGAR
jgi:hypothetical protein